MLLILQDKEAADQAGLTAEAWGVATEQLSQGIDKLSDSYR